MMPTRECFNLVLFLVSVLTEGQAGALIPYWGPWDLARFVLVHWTMGG